MDKPSKKWTARQLKAYIRKVTKEINKKYSVYVKEIKNKLGVINEVLEKEHETLYRLGKTHPDMTKKIGDVSEKNIGVGLSYKHKEELVRQARALDQFNNVDMFTQEAQDRYTDAERKAYNNFINDNRYNLDQNNFTLEDYHNLVETLGALDEKVNTFGYAELMALYTDDAVKERRVDVTSAAISINREIKGRGYSQKQAVELLRERIGI